MIPLCNFHTHTTFCDGKNTAEEMVRTAIAAGAVSIGFSGHSPLRVNKDYEDWCVQVEKEKEYQEEVLRLRSLYGNKIEILLGLEQDYFSKSPEYPYDYLIGSVHYVKKGDTYVAMDLDPKQLRQAIQELYGGNDVAMAKDYYELVADVYRKTACQIIGHFDLLTKFNEKHSCFDEAAPDYRKAALDAADELLKQNVLFEINTGAMSRGWRSSPYPAPFILRYLAEKKGKVIITGDSHSAEALFYAYQDAYEYAKSCGVKEAYVYQNGAFRPYKV